jgi:hypothetical protein
VAVITTKNASKKPAFRMFSRIFRLKKGTQMKKRRFREKRPKLGAMAARQSETAPSFTRILHKHGLCPNDMPVCAAFNLFVRVGNDPLVTALKPRAVVPRTNQLGIYAATAAALDSMTKVQLGALRERLENPHPSKEFR